VHRAEAILNNMLDGLVTVDYKCRIELINPAARIEDLSTIRKFLKVIKTETDRLELLIKDLLELSKLENRNEYVLHPGELNKVIDKVIRLFADKTAGTGIELKKEVEDELAVYMISE